MKGMNYNNWPLTTCNFNNIILRETMLMAFAMFTYNTTQSIWTPKTIRISCTTTSQPPLISTPTNERTSGLKMHYEIGNKRSCSPIDIEAPIINWLPLECLARANNLATWRPRLLYSRGYALQQHKNILWIIKKSC